MKVKVELRCSVVRRNEDEEIARGLKGARRDGRTERMKLMAAATATSVALMALAAAAVEGSFPCPAEDVTFELVTGHVFRSPDDILGRAPFFLPSSVIFSDQFNQYWLNLNKLCSITKTMFPPVPPKMWKKFWNPSPVPGHEDRRAAPRGLHRRMPRERVLPLGQLRDRAVRHVRLFGRAQAG